MHDGSVTLLVDAKQRQLPCHVRKRAQLGLPGRLRAETDIVVFFTRQINTVTRNQGKAVQFSSVSKKKKIQQLRKSLRNGSTVRRKTDSELIPPARKIEFESCK